MINVRDKILKLKWLFWESTICIRYKMYGNYWSNNSVTEK